MADELFKIQGTIDVDNKSANDAIDQTTQKAKGVASSMGSAFSSIGKTLGSVGKTFSTIGKSISKTVTAPVAALGVSTAKTAISFLSLKEGANTAFTVLLGSTDKAKKMLDDLYTFAKTTPFSYDTYLTAGKTLAAMGIEAEKVIPYLDGITNAAIATGIGQDGVNSLSKALGRMSSSGKITLETLNVLTYSGVPAIKILANQYKVTTEEILGMISEGEVLSEEALPKLIDGMNNGTNGAAGLTAAYGGLAKEMKGTLSGAMDSLHSAFRNAAIDMWDAERAYPELINLLKEFKNTVNFLPKIFGAVHDAAVPTLQKITNGLQTLNEKLNSADGERLKKIGEIILKLAAAGPILLGVGKAVTTVSNFFNSMSKTVEHLSPVFNKSKASLSKWKDSTKTYLTTAKSYFQDAKTDIKSAFGSIGTAIRNTGSSIGSAVSAVVTNVGGIIGAVGTAIKDTAGVIFEPLINKVNDIKDKFITEFTKIKDKVVDRFTDLKDKTVTKFTELKDKVVGKLTDLKDKAIDKATEIKNKIVTKFNEIKDKTVSKVTEFKDKAVTKFTELKDNASKVFSNIKEKIVEKFTPLKEKLIPIFDNLKSTISEKCASIKDKVSTAFSGFAEKVGAPLSKAFNSAKSAMGNFGKGLGAVGTAFSGVLKVGGALTVGLVGIAGAAAASGIDIQAKVDGIVEKVSSFADNLPTAITNMIPALQNGLNKIVEVIPQLVTGITKAVQGIADALPTLIPQLTAALTNLLTALLPVISSMIPTIIKAAVNLFNGLVSALPQILPSLISALISLVTSLVSVLPTFITDLINGAIQLFMGIVDALPQILPPLINALPQIIMAVINGLTSNIGTLINGSVQVFMAIVKAIPQIVIALADAAPDIIDGLIEGLKAGISALGDAALDLGRAILDSFKNFFGIHSPSTVMKEQGGFLTSGLVNGLSNIGSKVSDVFQNAKTKAVNKLSELKTSATNKATELKANVTNKFNEIKDKIALPIEKAKDAVKKAIEKIKSFFKGLKLEFPKIKLPHFKLTGKLSLSPPSVPKFGVDWYKNGGIFEEGIMTRPTAFGVAPNGNLRVGGEAEHEAVAPISKLQQYVAAAATSGNAELETKLDTLISLLTLYLPLLTNRELVLDTGAIIGTLAEPLDKALGDMATKKARGRA